MVFAEFVIDKLKAEGISIFYEEYPRDTKATPQVKVRVHDFYQLVPESGGWYAVLAIEIYSYTKSTSLGKREPNLEGDALEVLNEIHKLGFVDADEIARLKPYKDYEGFVMMLYDVNVRS